MSATETNPAWSTISRHSLSRAMQLGANARAMGLSPATPVHDETPAPEVTYGRHPILAGYALGYRTGVVL
jgi:hypothetical protein